MRIAPPRNKGIQTLKHGLFTKTLQLSALRIPAHLSEPTLKALRKNGLISLPRVKSVIDDQTNECRIVLLEPEIQAHTIEDLPPFIQTYVQTHRLELTQHSLQLTYDYWSVGEILDAILPDGFEVPTSFESVGHIAHLNLRDEHEPFKHIIGQVVLDKSKNITTVVNKVGNIDHTFRFFRMEVLAGLNDTMAQLKESNCQFRFDFSKVYWNSRLHSEHERIIRFFKPGDLVCDVFAGIGPFAIPAAKNSSCIVFANDLNPHSFEYLKENIEMNKVTHRVIPYNMDGREFIKKASEELNSSDAWDSLLHAAPKKDQQPKNQHTSQRASKKQKQLDLVTRPDGFLLFDHFVMNLPATAMEFLDEFKGIYDGKQQLIPDDKNLPVIHCHCFSRAENMEQDVIERVESILGTTLGSRLIQVHNVRNVAPNKDMLCISFRLPKEVAFFKKQQKVTPIEE